MTTITLPDALTVCNEIFVCLGSGICGCVAVMLSGSPTQYLQFAGYTAVGIGALLATLNFRQKRHVGPSNVVIITGCDSGLG